EDLLARSEPRVASTDVRPYAYRDAAEAVVDSVDVLIAVKRPDAGTEVGGTADTVKYAKRKRVPIAIVDATDPEGTRVPRVRCEAALFNRSRIRPATFARRERESRAVLISDAHEVGDAELEHIADWIAPRFARADTLAMRCQSLYYGLGLAVFLL